MADKIEHKRPTIVVVEDSETCQAALEIALSALRDVDLTIHSSAEAAVTMLDGGSNVCALVTDIHLEGMDGFELIRKVRAAAPELPIVVISGDTDPRAPALALELGASAYFEKPYSPGQVRRTLERLIHGKASTSQPA